MADDTPTGDDARAMLDAAVEAANAIEQLVAHLPISRAKLLALAIVAATAAQRSGLSPNDAFSVYLAVYETAAQEQRDTIAQAEALAAHLKNTIPDLVERGHLTPKTKKPQPH
jgi:hypothetical protein